MSVRHIKMSLSTDVSIKEQGCHPETFRTMCLRWTEYILLCVFFWGGRLSEIPILSLFFTFINEDRFLKLPLPFLLPIVLQQLNIKSWAFV